MCCRSSASRRIPKRPLTASPTMEARSLMTERLSTSSIRKVAENPYCSMPATLCAARRRGATKARPMITSPRPSKARPAMRKSMVLVLLDLDFDDLLDHEGAAHHEQRRDHEQDAAAQLREQRVEIVRVEQRDRDQQADRQQGDDPP